MSLQGENAWVFVSEEGMQDTVKHYFTFEDTLFAEAKKAAPKGTVPPCPTELSVVVMDNRNLSIKDVSCACYTKECQLCCSSVKKAKSSLSQACWCDIEECHNRLHKND